VEIARVLGRRPGRASASNLHRGARNRQSNRSRHNTLYSARACHRLSARVLRAWRGEHGNWCPGYQRPAHPAADLTVDHVVPHAAGGALPDIANTAVLCRSYNSTKGASTDRGEVALRGWHLAADRASRLCARGRVSPIIPVADRGSGEVRPPAPTSAGARRALRELMRPFAAPSKPQSDLR